MCTSSNVYTKRNYKLSADTIIRMANAEQVYCTECKHCIITKDSLYCPNSEKCYFYDIEDSAPINKRLYWEKKENDGRTKKK